MNGFKLLKFKDNFKKQSKTEEKQFGAQTYKLLSSIVVTAIKWGASDIHMEPQADKVVIRLRVDGDLQFDRTVDVEVYRALRTSIKLRANMDIAKTMVPQDGNIIWKMGDEHYDLRVATIPTIHGEKVVIRILCNNSALISLGKLGFKNSDLEKLQLISKINSGMVLVSGPTGSGKTTTLYALLQEIDKSKKNIITIEDPVEYKINGINQININEKAGLTFSEGVRSVLRQDPDIVMIGEIRDSITAENAIKASLTGHMVLSTLHTRDVVSSIMRLRNMEIQRYLISEAIAAIISQRLVNRLCDECKKEYKYIEKSGVMTYQRGDGCTTCRGSGKKGRTIVYEFLLVDEKIRNIISGADGVEEVRNHLKSYRFSTINDMLRELGLKGVIDYREYEDQIRMEKNIY